MGTPTRRDYRVPFVDLFDWLDPPLTIFRPVTGHPVRVEDYVTDGTYVVRAEVPGLDPEKDIEVTISKGVLTISAHRHEDVEGKHHSEFRYGTFARSVALPVGADESRVRASYDKGILEVVIGLKDQEAEAAHKRIPVTLTQHIKPT
jgi:HSP20 family molecular chaperone IbpA